LLILRMVTPSQMECTRAILGISIMPICTIGSSGVPDGATGWLSRGITTFGGVVVVVVGATGSGGGTVAAAREIATRLRGVAGAGIAARTTMSEASDATSPTMAIASHARCRGVTGTRLL